MSIALIRPPNTFDALLAANRLASGGAKLGVDGSKNLRGYFLAYISVAEA